MVETVMLGGYRITIIKIKRLAIPKGVNRLSEESQGLTESQF